MTATQTLAAAAEGPWSRAQWARLVMGHLLALAPIVIGWLVVRRQLHVQDQLTWLGVGFVGIGASGAVNGAFLLAGRRAVEAGCARVAGRVADRVDAVDETRESDATLMAAPLLSRYHRASCALVAGRSVRAACRVELEGEGLRPCEICEP